MANLIDTLHPKTSPSDNLYPNILTENIPSGAITMDKLSSTVKEAITSATPKIFDTEANILALTADGGVAVATDTGYVYTWDEDNSIYASTGVLYQATGIDNTYLSLYTGEAFRGNMSRNYSSYIVITKSNSDTEMNTYTQIMYAKNDITIKVSDSTTYICKKVTFTSGIGTNVTMGNWGSSISISKGEYFAVEIALVNASGTTISTKDMINNLYFSNNDYDLLINPTFVLYNSQTPYIEMINTENVTLDLGLLSSLGYKINLWKVTDWDVSNSQAKEVETGWFNNYGIITIPVGTYKLFFRKYDENNSLINFDYSEIRNNITYPTLENNKFIHISVDDCVFWTDLIDNANNYSSIFDNTLLGYYKTLHDTYGMTITLNCFNVSGAYDISNVPTNFKSEFSTNSNWLKLSFHAEDSTTYYNADKVDEITASYNKFITAVYNMTGNYECVDRVVRLGFFSGTSSNVDAIRDCDCGILGLLTADDTRVSYYLDTDTNNFILNHNKFFDTDKQLTLIKSQQRIEYMSDRSWVGFDTYYNNVDYTNTNRYLEIFTHEYEINSTFINYIRNCCLWAVTRNYKFDFTESILKL